MENLTLKAKVKALSSKIKCKLNDRYLGDKLCNMCILYLSEPNYEEIPLNELVIAIDHYHIGEHYCDKDALKFKYDSIIGYCKNL